MCAVPGGDARLAQVEDGSLHSESQGSLATNRKLQRQFSACLQKRCIRESEQVRLDAEKTASALEGRLRLGSHLRDGVNAAMG